MWLVLRCDGLLTDHRRCVRKICHQPHCQHHDLHDLGDGVFTWPNDPAVAQVPQNSDGQRLRQRLLDSQLASVAKESADRQSKQNFDVVDLRSDITLQQTGSSWSVLVVNTFAETIPFNVVERRYKQYLRPFVFLFFLGGAVTTTATVDSSDFDADSATGHVDVELVETERSDDDSENGNFQEDHSK